MSSAVSGGAGQYPAGGGSGLYTPSGILTSSVTSAGTIADTNETTLWTYTMPASTMNTDARGVRVSIYYTTAANANVKNGRLYFGATVVDSRTGIADNGVKLLMSAIILRTAATAQLATGNLQANGSMATPLETTPAETLSGAIVIKFTGQNGTASANDVLFKYATVELLA